MIGFQQQDHRYFSLDGSPRKWKSVTSVIHALKQPFDAVGMSEHVSRKRTSKWYNMKPEVIREAWDSENRRSVELGSWYHDKKEQELYNTLQELDVHGPAHDGDTKIAPDQRLQDGLYPEYMVYLQSVGICGQSDLVKVENKVLDITDYKSNKKIERKGWENWEGQTKKLLKPLSHLDECEFNEYSIQLSLYAYMIIRHNPLFKLGKLTIQHVKFEESGTNEYGYPIHAVDANNEPIIKDIEILDIPYLLGEVLSVITYLTEQQ